MVKNPPASAENARDVGSIPRLGRSPGGENSKPLTVLLPGEFHGQKSLVSYSPLGHKVLDINKHIHCFSS